MINKMRGIILISEETGDRQEFKSINGAASFLGSDFAKIQRAAIYNGVVKGWRVYEDPDAIRLHIADLEAQLKVLEG